ncbi:MAG TPA: sulfite exporter TauE/SafE family protein, partial [Ramlibacter sp.]|nr:sulfite exporter TauE/SafE family protein [Ramlibacter sp.]
MSTTLAATALLMGLAGGPHCAAMCGPVCSGVVRFGTRPATTSLWQFHAGRLAGYSLAGAVVAQAVESFGWLAGQT